MLDTYEFEKGIAANAADVNTIPAFTHLKPAEKLVWLSDLKDLQTTIPKGLFYVKFKNDNPLTNQELNFTYTDLNIVLPKF